MSARFKACTGLADAVKRAGFKGELGFQVSHSPQANIPLHGSNPPVPSGLTRFVVFCRPSSTRRRRRRGRSSSSSSRSCPSPRRSRSPAVRAFTPRPEEHLCPVCSVSFEPLARRPADDRYSPPAASATAFDQTTRIDSDRMTRSAPPPGRAAS